MSLLPTETVVISRPTAYEPDSLGDVQPTAFEKTSVPGCLLQPGVPQELSGGWELNQRRYLTVHLPKTYPHDPSNGTVEARGVVYSVDKTTLALTSSPLPWDRFLVCSVVA